MLLSTKTSETKEYPKRHFGAGLDYILAAVSHIPKFGDATTSLAGDAASPARDADVSAGDAHL